MSQRSKRRTNPGESDYDATKRLCESEVIDDLTKCDFGKYLSALSQPSSEISDIEPSIVELFDSFEYENPSFKTSNLLNFIKKYFMVNFLLYLWSNLLLILLILNLLISLIRLPIVLMLLL